MTNFKLRGYRDGRRRKAICLTLLASLDYRNDSTWAAHPAARFMAEHDRVATQTVEELLESTLESVDHAEETVLRLASAIGFDEDDRHRIGIAVRECMVNAVVHGNRYHSRKKVHLTVSRSGERLEILVGDEGGSFDASKIPDPLAEENLLRQSGRGLLMMRAFMDEFQVRPREPLGTEVRMVKYLAKAG